jgi:hypothetical protein
MDLERFGINTTKTLIDNRYMDIIMHKYTVFQAADEWNKNRTLVADSIFHMRNLLSITFIFSRRKLVQSTHAKLR